MTFQIDAFNRHSDWLKFWVVSKVSIRNLEPKFKDYEISWDRLKQANVGSRNWPIFHSKLADVVWKRPSQPTIGDIDVLVTSLRCWWPIQDVGDWFNTLKKIINITEKVANNDSVTNILNRSQSWNHQHHCHRFYQWGSCQGSFSIRNNLS